MCFQYSIIGFWLKLTFKLFCCRTMPRWFILKTEHSKRYSSVDKAPEWTVDLFSVTDCDTRLTCSDCVQNSACVWCNMTGLCLPGNIGGPQNPEFCNMLWYWSTCGSTLSRTIMHFFQHIFLSYLKSHCLYSGGRRIGNSWILYFALGLFPFCMFDLPRDIGLFNSLLCATWGLVSS
jgi:hypothetical protein